ncbi:MAG: cell wall-binding repeat-containing protein, partial [Lachnospiraceae bacterium]|nr:cell wall-binding repeat-containing protein [Lachnospiraceae bacterium]
EEGYSFTVYDNGGKSGVYKNNSDDFLTVKVPEGLQLLVNGDVNTEGYYDKLYLYDGDIVGAPSLGGNYYDGNTEINNLISSGDVTVRFKSDGSVQKNGFSLSFTIVTSTSLTLICGEQEQELTVADNYPYEIQDYYNWIQLSTDDEVKYWTDGSGEYKPGDHYMVYGESTLTAVTDEKNAVAYLTDGDSRGFNMYSGETFVLADPSDIFDTPEGYVSDGWIVNDDADKKVYTSEKYCIWEDTAFTAVWNEKSAWDELAELIANTDDDSLEIVLDEDLISSNGSSIIEIPEGLEVSIDLNGYTIDGTNVALNNGLMINVEGKLTLSDSKGSGSIIGGGLRYPLTGSVVFDFDPAEFFEAGICDVCYVGGIGGAIADWEDKPYSMVLFPTFEEALKNADGDFLHQVDTEDIKDTIIPADCDDYNVNLAGVCLFKDATIGKDETVELFYTGNYFDVFLNGHTLDIQGTIIMTEQDQYYGTESGGINLVGNSEGMLTCSGTVFGGIEVFSNDTVELDGAVVSGEVYVTSGDISIRDTRLDDDVCFDNNDNYLDLTVSISGKSEIFDLEIYRYGIEYGDMSVTVSDTVRIGSTYFSFSDKVTKDTPTLILEGGYYYSNPAGWVGEDKSAYISISGEPEEFDDQEDWAANPNYYSWRVGNAGADEKTITRVYGDSRFDTSLYAAAALKKELNEKYFDTVIVASGTNFPDALAGSSLAAVRKAPVLLTGKNNYDKTADYIKNNLVSGGTVYILGGTGAVPEEFEELLEGTTYRIKRFAGNGRLETNLEILKQSDVRKNSDILVCTADSFADSLSASATGLPILLVSKKLSDAQKEYLAGLGEDNNFYLIGGTGAVSETIESELAAYGTTERVAGATRFETSLAVAEKFFDEPHKLVFAYSENFPDGLSAGPLAQVLDTPLILTLNNDKWNKVAANYTKNNELNITEGFVIGGPSLISDAYAMNIIDPK